jgi:hypothetical protein
MQLSGTSFAAPVVSGTVAQIIARNPTWSPDQVKGALMLSARYLPASAGKAGGVGEITASVAARVKNPPNPNKGLRAFVGPVSGGGMAFNSASWLDVAKTNASWDSASWLDASWLDASWLDASWLDASWDSASWLDASWLDASWLDASWLDASWEDAAEGDALPTGAYDLDPSQADDLTGDLATDPAFLPDTAIVAPAAAPAAEPAPAPAPALPPVLAPLAPPVTPAP